MERNPESLDLNFPLLLTSNSESLNILPSFKKKWKHFVGYFWDKFYMDTLHATDQGLLRAGEIASIKQWYWCSSGAVIKWNQVLLKPFSLTCIWHSIVLIYSLFLISNTMHILNNERHFIKSRLKIFISLQCLFGKRLYGNSIVWYKSLKISFTESVSTIHK